MLPELPIEPVPEALVSWPLLVEPVPIEPDEPVPVEPVVPIEPGEPVPVEPVVPVEPLEPLPWAVAEPDIPGDVVSLGGVAAVPALPPLAVPLGVVADPCVLVAPPAVPWVPSTEVDDVRPVSFPAGRVSLLPLAQATIVAATSARPPKVTFISASLRE
jgi:hypothetical protein